jgi:hypothetical protein
VLKGASEFAGSGGAKAAPGVGRPAGRKAMVVRGCVR